MFLFFKYELEQLVCGSKVIDVERLMANTEYDDDITSQDSHIQYLWEVVKEFTEEEKSLFLRSVWARPTCHPKMLNFHRNSKYKVQLVTMQPDNQISIFPKLTRVSSQSN